MCSVDRAVHWLLHSGIQASCGGFHGWYDLESEVYPFLYSEATGYAIPLLLELGETSRAARAGEWLIKKAYLKDRMIRSHLYYRESEFRPTMYTFDNAVCLKALVCLYRATRQHRYLEYAWRIGDWLLRLQEPNGRFKAVYPPLCDRGWSVQPGAYHAKNAVALLKLSELTNESRYVQAARHVCEWTLKQQKPDGSFPVVGHLHPLCYAAEGLLYVGRKLGDPRFVDAAEKAVTYLLKQEIKRTDVLAQASVLTAEFGLPCTEILLHNLMKRQCCSIDKRADGGFLFNQKHVNSWTTIFAVEAMRRLFTG